jgi:trehalose 6-phosphate synthase
MNLVAKEYVACQNPEDPGVLILSRFAGAAAECTAALLVNPYDPESVGAAIERALSMPLDERRSRNTALFQVLMTHDAKNWGERFLGALTREQDDPIGVPWVRTDRLSTLSTDREAEEHSAVD